VLQQLNQGASDRQSALLQKITMPMRILAAGQDKENL